jgi:hypothetical protein
MQNAPVNKEKVLFVGGVLIMQKSMSACIKRISQQPIPTQKKDSPSWLNPFSKMASYICYPYRAYQKIKSQHELNTQFVQAVIEHIAAIESKAMAITTKRTLDRVEYLLDQGANPDSEIPSQIFWRKACSPLYLAADTGASDLAKLLIEKKADIDKGLTVKSIEDYNTPLFLAVFHDFSDIAHLLLDNGAIIEEKSSQLPLIFYAARKKNAPLVKKFLELGATKESIIKVLGINQYHDEVNFIYQIEKEQWDIYYKKCVKYCLQDNTINCPGIIHDLCNLITDYVSENESPL